MRLKEKREVTKIEIIIGESDLSNSPQIIYTIATAH